jgi:nicotine blue oxidoreductase
VTQAILLAAGAGLRMGQPKALLEVHGELLVLQHLRRLRAVGVEHAVVVLPPAVAQEVEQRCAAHLEPGWVTWLPRATASQAHSLAAAAQALHARGGSADRAVFVSPVDLRPAQEATLRLLLARLTPGVRAVTPVAEGRDGHPVLLRSALLGRYLEPGALPSLRDTLDGEPTRLRVNVDDAAVLGDFDTPADLAALE